MALTHPWRESPIHRGTVIFAWKRRGKARRDRATLRDFGARHDVTRLSGAETERLGAERSWRGLTGHCEARSERSEQGAAKPSPRVHPPLLCPLPRRPLGRPPPHFPSAGPRASTSWSLKRLRNLRGLWSPNLNLTEESYSAEWTQLSTSFLEIMGRARAVSGRKGRKSSLQNIILRKRKGNPRWAVIIIFSLGRNITNHLWTLEISSCFQWPRSLTNGQ